jgi:hypothetical protein
MWPLLRLRLCSSYISAHLIYAVLCCAVLWRYTQKTDILARERSDKHLKRSLEEELQALKYGLHSIDEAEFAQLKASAADLIIEWKKEKAHGKKGIEDLKDDLKAKEKLIESFVRERDVLNQKIMAKVEHIREKDAVCSAVLCCGVVCVCCDVKHENMNIHNII